MMPLPASAMHFSTAETDAFKCHVLRTSLRIAMEQLPLDSYCFLYLIVGMLKQ
jgi:hypothetical protein